MRYFYSLILLYLPVLWNPATAQEKSLMDTVYVPAGAKIIINKTRHTPQTDTIYLISEGSRYKVKYPPEYTGTNFFDSLALKASKKKWIYRLRNVVIKSSSDAQITDTLHTEKSGSAFLPYSGQTIRNIEFKKLEPFGPSITDTTGISTSAIENFGNELHSITKDHVIENHLLFKAGERLDPLKISDNERLIRDLPFIEDARIQVSNPSESTDSVDLIVIVKDAFSIGLGGEIKDINAGNIEIFGKNLLGSGHQFHDVFHWDKDKQPWLGNESFYIINNIGGSFINSKARYSQVFDTETFELDFDRGFFTPDIKYAGGFRAERTQTVKNIKTSDTTFENTVIKYNHFDSWIGRSFYLSSRSKLTRMRTNLVLSSRLFKEHYFDRPEVDENLFYEFHHKTHWLISIGLSQQYFFRSNLIYSFGRTEDIPQGMLINFTFGPEHSEFNSRLYTGFSFSRGGYLVNAGYLYSYFDIGGYWEDFNYIEQGTLRYGFSYFTNLFIINRFKFRHFLRISYVRGIRRLEDETVDINDAMGIRGFKLDEVNGTHKIILNYEATAFSPYYFYGFRFVFLGFTDLGMVGPDIESVFANKFHAGFGLGIRLRNERLVFETIQLRLGYYPTMTDKFPLSFDLSGEKRLKPDDFYVRKPEVIRFE